MNIHQIGPASALQSISPTRRTQSTWVLHITRGVNAEWIAVKLWLVRDGEGCGSQGDIDNHMRLMGCKWGRPRLF